MNAFTLRLVVTINAAKVLSSSLENGLVAVGSEGGVVRQAAVLREGGVLMLPLAGLHIHNPFGQGMV